MELVNYSGRHRNCQARSCHGEDFMVNRIRISMGPDWIKAVVQLSSASFLRPLLRPAHESEAAAR
jgi:hypothetical protein